MGKNIAFTLLIALPFLVFPQKEVLRKAEKINWYGLDFSMAKFIGPEDFPEPEKLCNDYIHSEWNSKIFRETKRYEIDYAFPGKMVELYPEVVRDINTKITPNGLVGENQHPLDLKACQIAVNRYPSINTKGLSCVFLVESFNKRKREAYIWVVVFEPFTKEIYYAKRYAGGAHGGGLVNYWLGSVRDVIGQMRRRVLFNR